MHKFKTLALALAIALPATAADYQLLNVSYDPTRELYQDINKQFAADYKKQTGDTVTIKQSHGGSGKQARSVIDGLEADVVTLGIPQDINEISSLAKLLPANWATRLPHDSEPYYSTVVFLVRKGNPKQIKDWSDLVKPGVQVITSNPKTSAGGRWAYLAGWGYAATRAGGSPDKAKAFITELYKHVPVLDSGARGSTVTFVERGVGDVLIAWENEALLALKELEPGKFEIVTPSESILAEPPVSVVDKVADKHGTRKVAEAYLKYLYTPAAQEVIAQNYYRPRDEAVAAKYAKQYPKVKLFTFEKVFGTWEQANKQHFADGGNFDQIYQPAK